MTRLLDQALELAWHGFPVFPVGADKRPACANGFKDASTDTDTISRLFAHPSAQLIGVPTGAVSGIDVLDVDPAGAGWMREYRSSLPKTRTHATRRDGFHVLFKHAEGVGSRAGRIAEGIDVRGDGGYFVWWAAAGFRVHDDSPIAAMPEWLHETIIASQGRAANATPQPPKAPIDLAPPSADALLSLLSAMLNPAEAGRDDYVAVCLAVQGALRGGIALERITDEQADAIKDAAAEWAARWEGATPSDFATERDRWTTDWELRENDVSGWRSLLALASRLGADVSAYAAETTADEFARAPLPPDPPKPVATADQRIALNDLMSIETWADCDIPEPDRLLGDMLTTTTRGFFVGRTGLGKTMFGMGMACGVAAGAGFLQWPPGRPAKVLFVDGEMPAELIKPRAIEAMRRLGCPIPRHNLVIFGRDIDDKAHEVFPALPPFAPLNTDAGHRFLFALIDAVGDVDVLFLDNVMSLLAGDQKDEVTWSGVNELVQQITLRRIGQVWFDHTGHNSDRQYGSSTKAWKFDVVGVMTPLPDRADARETAFNLSFDHPGKARRRTPYNWQEFQEQTIRLVDDRWTFEPVQKAATKAADTVKPAARARYEVLMLLLSKPGATGSVTRTEWYLACVSQALEAPIPPDANGRDRDRIVKGFRARMSELREAGWIDVNGETVTSLRGFK